MAKRSSAKAESAYECHHGLSVRIEKLADLSLRSTVSLGKTWLAVADRLQ
jgi:hypothetical protein